MKRGKLVKWNRGIWFRYWQASIQNRLKEVVPSWLCSLNFNSKFNYEFSIASINNYFKFNQKWVVFYSVHGYFNISWIFLYLGRFISVLKFWLSELQNCLLCPETQDSDFLARDLNISTIELKWNFIFSGDILRAQPRENFYSLVLLCNFMRNETPQTMFYLWHCFRVTPLDAVI